MRRGWYLGMVAASTLTGCVSYTTEIRREATRGDVTVAVEEAHAPSRGLGRVEISVRSIPSDVQLLGATLSDSAQSFCSGVRATNIGREGGRAPDAPLVPGEHVALGFPRLGPLDSDAPHLDLWLGTSHGTHRCVTIPLAAPGQHLEWSMNERFTVGLDLDIEGFPSSLGPVDRFFGFPVEVGAWFGRYHAEVGAGVAGAACPDSQCPAPSDGGKLNYSTAIPIFAGVRWIGHEWGQNSIGAGLRYRAMHFAADTYEGRKNFWAHGPVLSPYFGFTSPPTNGKGGGRQALIAIEVPIGYAFAEGGDGSVSVGVNIAMLFTMF